MHQPAIRYASALVFLFLAGFTSIGCALIPERILIKQGRQGAVYLESAPGSLTTSHPVSLSPDLLANIFAAIQIGIQPSDRIPHSEGIKPITVFSPQEVTFLAPTVANALRRAESDHLVTFQIGPETERTDGALFVEGPNVHISFNHYRSTASRRDESLPLYILSLAPEYAHALVTTSPIRIGARSDQPHLAIAYEKVVSVFVDSSAPSGMSSPVERFTTSPPAGAGKDLASLQDVVDQQASEIQSLKAEIEALKKQLEDQSARAKPKPKPLPKPGRP